MFINKEQFKAIFTEKLAQHQEQNTNAKYEALVETIQSAIKENWENTIPECAKDKKKIVYYFSMEFLIGKLLDYYLNNLKIKDMVAEVLEDLNISLEELIKEEEDAGLGNGGLGRLAACYLDSMAYLNIPGHGNGIRFRCGLFKQEIENGYQVEEPDNWLEKGYPWEVKRADKAIPVKFYGQVSTEMHNRRFVFHHENYELVRAIPYDVPIISGGEGENINTLRLWSVEGDDSHGNVCNYDISNILYPDDHTEEGKILRLKQEYFFVAAGLGSIVRYYKNHFKDIRGFAEKIAIHINDTHPALCVPELMRILMDEEGLEWDEAWRITRNTMSYTNHTIMPEALERWPVYMMTDLLPRIMMIITEIDRRYKDDIYTYFLRNRDIVNNTSIIFNEQVFMANLAVIGSHSVNGVSKLHSEILKNDVHPDFNMIYPHKYCNVTNGISYRRFLANANPLLAETITSKLGDGWLKDADKLKELLPLIDDDSFLLQLKEVKHQNKLRLASFIYQEQGLRVNPNAVFDVQVKRIHAYKRQLLNVLRIMDIYNRIKDDTYPFQQPQVFIFGGKAAPGYYYAKKVIKLINSLADKVNNDPDIGDRMKVVFIKNFNVSKGELIYPAADISEQISTASREASGTGNMKFMLNGAVTLGTLDGANVEISEVVGKGNIEIFGLKAEEVLSYSLHGGYESYDLYNEDPRLKKVVDQLNNGFLAEDSYEFQDIQDSLIRDNDHFFVLGDFKAYVNSSDKLLNIYQKDQLLWQSMCLKNIATGGIFSSDRSIREYARKIWNI